MSDKTENNLLMCVCIVLVIALLYLFYLWWNKDKVASFTSPLNMTTTNALLDNRANYFGNRGWNAANGEKFWSQSEAPAFWENNQYTSLFRDNIDGLKASNDDIKSVAEKKQEVAVKGNPSAGASTPVESYHSQRPAQLAATGNISGLQQRETFGDDGNSFTQSDLMGFNKGVF
jgi:hypothetical protein